MMLTLLGCTSCCGVPSQNLYIGNTVVVLVLTSLGKDVIIL